jgi:hypothetical protein
MNIGMTDTPDTHERLNRLLQKEKQLQAQIQAEKSRLGTAARKQRDGRLISWGVAVEQLLADETFKAEWWTLQCQRVLSGRTLERALAGFVKTPLKPEDERENLD